MLRFLQMYAYDVSVTAPEGTTYTAALGTGVDVGATLVAITETK
jgi:acetylornithine/succinyldiaminopimelate/putrescine aminotransferase